jgi:hypothetical protein
VQRSHWANLEQAGYDDDFIPQVKDLLSIHHPVHVNHTNIFPIKEPAPW